MPRWNLPLYVTLAALLLGIAFEFAAGGRVFAVSFIDLAAVGIGVAGGVAAWRRGRVRLDRAIAAYVAFLAVVAAQIALRPEPLAILGGSSRFVTPLLLLFGLSQLVPERHGAAQPVWRWPVAIAAFAGAIAVIATVQLVLALADPALDTFYLVKKSIEMPIGASNYVAAFVLVGVLVGGAHAAVDARWILPTALLVLGLLATLSRGAVIALVLTVAIGAVVLRAPRFLVTAGVSSAIALAAFAIVVAGGTMLGQPPPDPSPDPPLPPTAAADADAADADPGTDQPPSTAQPGPAETSPPRAERVAAALPQSGAVLEGALSDVSRGRLALYRAAWEAYLDHPWIGVGLNRLETVTAPTGEPHVNAHNLFLHSLASVGLFGTLAYLAIWVLLALRVRRMPRGPLRMAIGLAALALFLHAQVEALAFTRAVEALIAVLLVLSASVLGADPVVYAAKCTQEVEGRRADAG